MGAIPPTAVISELASRQHGVVTRRQLIARRIPSSTISRWIRVGYLQPLHKGVYAVGHRRTSREARWLAGVLACGARASLNHGAAGQSRGILPLRQRLAVHVSVPRRSGADPDGVVVHRVRSLDPRDVSLHHGIPTTTATRTVWDLASVLTPLQTRRAFEQAEKLHLLDRPRLAALRAAVPSRRGAAVVRQLLAEAPLPLDATRSRLEELVLETCRDHGLPLPAVNVPVRGWEVDFLWERERLIVEADGGDHFDPAQREIDNRRDVELGQAGFLVRRWGTGPVTEKHGIAAELASLLGEQRR